jgi:hypothetical protein
MEKKGHPLITRFNTISLKSFIEANTLIINKTESLKNIMPVLFLIAQKKTNIY